MGGKNKPQSTTQTMLPPRYIQQAQQDILGQAKGLYGGYQDPNAVFTPFNETSLGALGALGGAGQTGQQTVGQLSDTLSGEYLGESNPYLQDLVSRAQRSTQSGINATFGGAGRTGGGLHQQALTTGLGDVAASIYAPAYETERGRQFSAIGMAPQAYSPYNIALGAGGLQEQKQQQQGVAEAMEANQPWTALNQYANLVGGIQGGNVGTTTGPGRSPIAGGLGGAAAGAGLSSALGWAGPWGALAGGALGLLGAI